MSVAGGYLVVRVNGLYGGGDGGIEVVDECDDLETAEQKFERELAQQTDAEGELLLVEGATGLMVKGW